MPFVSQKQRAYMYSQHPDIAKRFEAETPKGKKLPKRKRKKRRKGSLARQLRSPS